jgi:hypothetical protein
MIGKAHIGTVDVFIPVPRLAMAFVIVGAVLQTSAFTVPHLIVGRIITGVGTGILCRNQATTRLLIAEFRLIPDNNLSVLDERGIAADRKS